MCCRRVPTGQAPKRAQSCWLSQPLELDRPSAVEPAVGTGLSSEHPAADAQCWHPLQSRGWSSSSTDPSLHPEPQQADGHPAAACPARRWLSGSVLLLMPTWGLNLLCREPKGWGQQLPEDLSSCFSFSSALSLWVQAVQLCLTSPSHRLHVSGIFWS